MFSENSEILVLPVYYKWKLFLYTYESEKHCLGHTKFVISPNKAGDLWLIQGIHENSNSTKFRALLMENWRGLEYEELVEKSKIQSLVYVNADGTQAGSKDLDGAIKLADESYKKLYNYNYKKIE